MTETPKSDTHVPSRVFARAAQDAESARGAISTPQTENPAYRLAFQDMDFLLREDLRPVRFQLELLKPQLLLDEAKIGSTFVMYGSARIPEPAKAKALLAEAGFPNGFAVDIVAYRDRQQTEAGDRHRPEVDQRPEDRNSERDDPRR